MPSVFLAQPFARERERLPHPLQQLGQAHLQMYYMRSKALFFVSDNSKKEKSIITGYFLSSFFYEHGADSGAVEIFKFDSNINSTFSINFDKRAGFSTTKGDVEKPPFIFVILTSLSLYECSGADGSV